jgi:hypothetical protein
MKLHVLAARFVLAVLAGCAHAPNERTQFSQQLQRLNAELLSGDSATLTLERWCEDHHLAVPARVYARQARGAAKPLPTELRARLQIGADEAIAYRHVQLVCGNHVLSEADNWYVPGRLTPEMNHQLDTTDQPFGKVVKALGFRRQTLAAQILWKPALPQAELPRELLLHSAVLYTATQVPFSVVVETYQRGLFDTH